MGTPLLFFFFFLLFMRLFPEIEGGIQYDECKAPRCRHHGPIIRFPFRLKDQPVPDHCGYPGFELTCLEEKRTILELPNSAKLWVKEIDYTSQEMVVLYGDEYCPQRRIVNLNLYALPFQFTESTSFSFFNCSEKKSESDGFWGSIPSTCSSSDPVYFTRSPNYLSQVDLTSCRKIFNATIPEFILFGDYEMPSMNWSKPMCGNCEAQGEKCQLKKKSNSREPEIECIPKPGKGT